MDKIIIPPLSLQLTESAYGRLAALAARDHRSLEEVAKSLLMATLGFTPAKKPATPPPAPEALHQPRHIGGSVRVGVPEEGVR